MLQGWRMPSRTNSDRIGKETTISQPHSSIECYPMQHIVRFRTRAVWTFSFTCHRRFCWNCTNRYLRSGILICLNYSLVINYAKWSLTDRAIFLHLALYAFKMMKETYQITPAAFINRSPKFMDLSQLAKRVTRCRLYDYIKVIIYNWPIKWSCSTCCYERNDVRDALHWTRNRQLINDVRRYLLIWL